MYIGVGQLRVAHRCRDTRTCITKVSENTATTTGRTSRRRGRTARLARMARGKSEGMITLGVVLMLLGLVLGIPILWTVGIILLVVGLVLMLMGRTGRQVGGRAHYW